MSCFSETFWVSDRYFGPKMAKNEVSEISEFYEIVKLRILG